MVHLTQFFPFLAALAWLTVPGDGHCRDAVAGDAQMNAPPIDGRNSTQFDTPPFHADEFWKSVLALLEHQNGFITKERFEEVMGVSLKKRYEEEMGVGYELRKGRDWYVGVALTITNEKFVSPGIGRVGVKSLLSFDLQDEAKQIYGKSDYGWCIPLNMAVDSIVSLGWRLLYKRDVRSLVVRLRRDDKDADITLGYTVIDRRNCVYSMSSGSVP